MSVLADAYDKWLQAWSLIMSVKIPFLKNYATSEGVVSHNVLYYQKLFIAISTIILRVVSIPMVSSAFNSHSETTIR